jgi:quercetin dioxygenase-like cupin family protein
VILQALEHRLSEGDQLRLPEAPRVVYDVDANQAEYSPGPGTLTGPRHALAFEVVDVPSEDALLSTGVTAPDGDQLLLRCDRVDFPPGGVAYLHTHQGPGIRVLLFGAIRIDTHGQMRSYAPLEAWFEPGPEPVYAAASASETTAFVRCMVLPPSLKGQSSIRYLREEDAEKPKPQRYSVFVDELVARP